MKEKHVQLCDHCRRVIGSENGDGYATVGEMVLCHPDPTVGPPRPNCFKLVATYGHKKNCSVCRLAGMAVKA